MASVKFAKTEEVGVQTVLVSCNSVSTETVPFPAKSTQTESVKVVIRQRDAENSGGSSKGLQVDPSLVDMVCAEIAKFHRENTLFTAIDRRNAGEQISLVLEKIVSLPATDRLPIVGVKCGNSAGRVAVLFGQRSHNSWCTHNGRMMVYQQAQWHGTYLSNCPTQVQFSAHNNQVIVSTALGEVLVVADGETIWSSTSSNMHSLGVTCIVSYGPKQFLSTGLDGRLNLLQQNPTNLEVLKTATITLNDLPRSLRKGNALNRKAGLVGVAQGQNAEIYVAGETGAVLAIGHSDLTVESTVAVEPEGIEQLAYVPLVDGFVLRTPDGQLKLMSGRNASTGETSRRILPTLRAKADFCIKGSMVIVVNEAENELIGWDLVAEQVVLREPIAFAAIALTDDGGSGTSQLVGVAAEPRNNLNNDIIANTESLDRQRGRQLSIYRFSNEIY